MRAPKAESRGGSGSRRVAARVAGAGSVSHTRVPEPTRAVA